MLRKMLAATVLMLAVVASGVVATVSPAAAAATPTSTSSTDSTTWYIYSTYSTYEECNDAGSYGQAAGQWISYYCEYNSDEYGFYYYSLWVEVPYTPPPRCATPGHAYVVYNHVAYWSGYEGDERNGVPTLSLPRGSIVTVGGNGIEPGQTVFFDIYDDYGNLRAKTKSAEANDNCVANERGFIIGLYPGHYLVKAYYRSGNAQQNYYDRVTFLQVW